MCVYHRPLRDNLTINLHAGRKCQKRKLSQPERAPRPPNYSRDVIQSRVRILFGSTQKAGSGTNVQERLIGLHHLDAPWRPADVEQREGRILRQGNKNPVVQIYRYLSKGSFDAYMWQTLETKAKFISQVMSGDMTIRRLEDLDSAALTYAEVKAIASGNPLVIEKAQVDAELMRLTRLRSAHRIKRVLPGSCGDAGISPSRVRLGDLKIQLRLPDRFIAGVQKCRSLSTVASPEAFLFARFGIVDIEHSAHRSPIESESVFIARTFWFEPAKRGPVAGVATTPNAQPIAFQQVVPEYFRTLFGFSRVKKLLALLLALGVCEFVTPSPNRVWNWRRGSESGG
jgi:hypothetical protein